MFLATRTASVWAMLSVVTRASERRGRDARHGAAREHAMRDIGRDRARAALLQGLGGVAQRAGAVDDVVDQDARAALDVADDVHHLGHAGVLAPLVDDGEIGIEAARDDAGAHHAADIGRDDDETAAVEAVLDVFDEHRRGIEIVGRDVEEALDLPGMQVERQHPVGAGDGDHVGDELGRDRRARARFAVLAGIAVIGDDGGDAARRGALQRIERDQQLHQIVVRGIGRRLDHEHVLAAHVLVHLDEHFHVGEAPHARVGERQFQIRRNSLGQRPIAVARENFHAKVAWDRPQRPQRNRTVTKGSRAVNPPRRRGSGLSFNCNSAS